MSRVKMIGIDFAFNCIYLFPTAFDYKIHFPPGFVSPGKQVMIINDCAQDIEQQVLPQKTAVILPNTVPTFHKRGKTCVKGIAFRSARDFTPSPSLELRK